MGPMLKLQMRIRDAISVSKSLWVYYETELMPHLSEHLLHISTIDLVAKHHVCDRIKEQSDAFTRGVSSKLHHN